MKLKDIIPFLVLKHSKKIQNPCGEIPLGKPEKFVLPIPGGKAIQYENQSVIKLNPIKKDFVDEFDDFDGWIWDDEDDNDLESLCDHVEIKITAKQLRGLLNAA